MSRRRINNSSRSACFILLFNSTTPCFCENLDKMNVTNNKMYIFSGYEKLMMMISSIQRERECRGENQQLFLYKDDGDLGKYLGLTD